MSASDHMLFVSFFDHSLFHHRGDVEYHIPYGERLKIVPSSKIITPSVGYRAPATGTVLNTSMEATAVPHHSDPNESVASTSPVPAATGCDL